MPAVIVKELETLQGLLVSLAKDILKVNESGSYKKLKKQKKELEELTKKNDKIKNEYDESRNK